MSCRLNLLHIFEEPSTVILQSSVISSLRILRNLDISSNHYFEFEDVPILDIRLQINNLSPFDSTETSYRLSLAERHIIFIIECKWTAIKNFMYIVHYMCSYIRFSLTASNHHIFVDRLEA